MEYESSFDMFASTFFGLLLFLIVFLLAVFLVVVIAQWKMFKKAGKSGWEAIVPFYNTWILVEISGLNWWWFLIILSTNIVSLIGFDSLSPIAGLASTFASFVCFYNIAKKFNKDTGTAICAGIFSFIFIFIFAFSKKAVYDANIPVSKNGIFGPVEGNNVNQSASNNVVTPNNVNTYASMVDNTNSQNIVNTNETPFNNNNVKFCGNCGTRLSTETRFCPNCGTESK